MSVGTHAVTQKSVKSVLLCKHAYLEVRPQRNRPVFGAAPEFSKRANDAPSKALSVKLRWR